MSIRTRLRALERQKRRATLVTCPHCRHASPPEEQQVALSLLPSGEELRQLPAAELVRMYLRPMVWGGRRLAEVLGKRLPDDEP
jgi:hypothetical protein